MLGMQQAADLLLVRIVESNQQHTYPGNRGIAIASVLSRKRHLKPERAPLHPRAFYPNPTTHQFNQLPRNRGAQPGAAKLPSRTLIGLNKRMKYLRNRLR